MNNFYKIYIIILFSFLDILLDLKIFYYVNLADFSL